MSQPTICERLVRLLPPGSLRGLVARLEEAQRTHVTTGESQAGEIRIVIRVRADGRVCAVDVPLTYRWGEE